MSIGLVGRKVGMTRIFTDNGASVPVTVLEVSNNRVTQVRTPETALCRVPRAVTSSCVRP